MKNALLKFACNLKKLTVVFQTIMNNILPQHYSICTHPECKNGYGSHSNVKRNVCGIHKYPLLHRCFFCGEESLIPGEQFCTYCGADIEESKLDIVFLYLIPYIDPTRKDRHHQDFPENYRNRLKEEAKLFFPIIEILNKDQDDLRHKISLELRDTIRAKADDFGKFVDEFRKKYQSHLNH